MSQAEIRQAELQLRENNTRLHRSVDELVDRIDGATVQARKAVNVARDPSRFIKENPQGSLWLLIAFGFAVGQLLGQAMAMRESSTPSTIELDEVSAS